MKKCPKCPKGSAKQYDSKKYSACYNCNYRACEKCDKRNVKVDSNYNICYRCYFKE